MALRPAQGGALRPARGGALRLRIAHLYPRLMNIYGDRGNILCLVRRCRERDIEVEVAELSLGDPFDARAHDLIFVGSPDTVARKLKAAAEEGLFNVVGAELNVGTLPEPDLMRSIRLFGNEVMPALRDVDPLKETSG